jgi:hypothetical protein
MLNFLSLKSVLALDAASCLVMGVGLAALAQPLAGVTGLPAGLLTWAGVLLLPVAALIGVAAALRAVPRGLLLLIVAGNAGWVLASLALLASGLVAPNGLGVALVLAQAAAVAVLTALEARGLGAVAPAQGA